MGSAFGCVALLLLFAAPLKACGGRPDQHSPQSGWAHAMGQRALKRLPREWLAIQCIQSPVALLSRPKTWLHAVSAEGFQTRAGVQFMTQGGPPHSMVGEGRREDGRGAWVRACREVPKMEGTPGSGVPSDLIACTSTMRVRCVKVINN